MPSGAPSHRSRPISQARSSRPQVRRAVLTIVLVCAGFTLVLAIWNLLVVRWQESHVVVPGAFYSVEGRKMHLYCAGSGSPPIVVETGVGSTSLGWYLVQEKLSALTRICTYDRAGLGWSEPREGPQDAERIAGQLHTLLNEAGVPRPLLLVGHSGGGLYIREYTREFPDEVAGLVFVDSSTPQQLDDLPGFRADYEKDKRNATRDLWLDRLLVWSGWARLLGKCRGGPDKGFERYASLYDAKECRPGYVDTDMADYLGFEEASKQAGRLTYVGEKPVLVLSKDPNRPGMNQKALAEAPYWEREQEGLKSLSSRSWRVVARGSSHNLFKQRADLVVAQIASLIEYLRDGPAPPFGSTTTQ